MTKIPLNIVSFTFLFALLTMQHSLCADRPQISPAPSPESGAEVDAVPPPPADIDSPTPSPSPSTLSSPPSPPPADLAPETSPSPAPSPASGNRWSKSLSPSPAPSPAKPVAADVSHESNADGGDLEWEKSSDDGLKGGQKAGIVFGVIAGVCVVGLGAKVYKKRQQNIRRAQFAYALRSEIL